MEEKVYNILKEIKEICTRTKCSVCPFANENHACLFIYGRISPIDWYITPVTEIYRAVKF